MQLNPIEELRKAYPAARAAACAADAAAWTAACAADAAAADAARAAADAAADAGYASDCQPQINQLLIKLFS